MTHTFTRFTRAVGAGVAALCIAGGALLVTSPGPATAGTTPPALDHFLCYVATAKGFSVNPNLLLKNVIQPAAFAPKVGTVAAHCNPANKSVPVAVFRAKNPLAHLLCWKVTFSIKPVVVALSNQFGKATMTAGSPTRLCLPSWKSNLAPPSMTPSAPPRLDHFTCYPLAATAAAYGFHVPSPVKAEDEFSAPRFTALKLGIANSLCVPTTKIAAGVVYPPQAANDLSLVCFPSSPTPLWRVVYDQNQFGQGTVLPTPKEEFCLPSTVQVRAATGG